jgi:hypothetical protein
VDAGASVSAEGSTVKQITDRETILSRFKPGEEQEGFIWNNRVSFGSGPDAWSVPWDTFVALTNTGALVLVREVEHRRGLMGADRPPRRFYALPPRSGTGRSLKGAIT